MLLVPWILFIIIHFQFSLEHDIINLIADFVKVQNSPTKLTAYLCWTKRLKLELSKELSKSYFNHQIRPIQSPLQHPSTEEHHMVILDASCVGFEDVLQQAQELKLFNQPFRWLILGAKNNLIFNSVYFAIDSRVYVMVANDLGFGINTVYKHSANSAGFVENSVAIWKRSQGFSQFSEISETKNRMDLMGTVITISYVVTNSDTLNHLWDYSSLLDQTDYDTLLASLDDDTELKHFRYTHIDAISKLNWILTHHLIEFVNATQVKIFRDSWGYKNATTSLYTGMIGDLQTDIAEFGGTASFFTIDRIDIVDYMAATARTFMRFIFRAPPLTYVTNVFTLPFETYVWYCGFALMAVISAVIYPIVVWEWKNPVFKTKHETVHSLRPSIFDVLLLEIGAVSQQGADAEPRSNAGRIATIFTFISLMFMYTSYSANIVALLQSTTDSIRTLEDLLASRISLGVEDIIYGHYYFENAQEPIRKAIYEQKIAPKGQKPNFLPAVEGMRRVQQGFFAFHIELSTGYKLVNELFQESEKCSLKEIEYINLIEPWLLMKKNSSYKEIFKIGLKKIHESGIQRREAERIYSKKPKCHGTGNNFGSVGLIDCYAAFLFFGIGLACSFMLMILELLLRRYQERKLSAANEIGGY